MWFLGSVPCSVHHRVHDWRSSQGMSNRNGFHHLLMTFVKRNTRGGIIGELPLAGMCTHRLHVRRSS
jgi:hypothetical protein